MIKRIVLLISIVLFSVSIQAQGIRTFHFSHAQKYTPPVGHNAYVEAVLAQAATDGVDVPSDATVEALDDFFNSINSVMSKAEMIKIGYLWDEDLLQFSRYNYVNPAQYKSVFYNGDPVYSFRGWSSDGDSYIDDIITMKRRANLQLNSSSIVVTDAFANTSVDQAACGSVSGNFYVIRPYYTGASSYYFAGLNHIGNIASVQNGFTGVSTSGSGGTVPRWLQNSTYKNGASLTTEMTNDLPVFTCAYNNAGTAIKFYTVGNIQFRWEGQELTDGEMELIRDSWNTYVTAITPTWTAGADITSTGRELFLVFGDSKTGTSPSVGVRNSPNSALQYNRTASALQEILGADLVNVPSVGSMWPKFCKTYHSETNGKTPVISLYGLGGSSVYNTAFVNSSWDNLTGTTYASAKTAHDAAIAALGVTKPKGIFIILGINDGNRTETLSTMLDEITSLISRIQTHYAGGIVPIYMSLFSKPNAATTQQAGRQSAMKLRMKDLETANSNLYITVHEGAIFGSGLQDNTHFDYAGNELFATWSKAFIDNAETDKDVRRIQAATFISTLSDEHKAAYKTFIEAEKANGNWDNYAALEIHTVSNASNIYTDLIGLATVFNHSSTANLNEDNQYNGSSTYLETGFEQTLTPGNATLNDVIIGVRTTNADTPQNTQATLFGQYNGTNYTLVRQNTSAGLDWGVNVASGNIATYTGGAGKIPVGADVAIRRSAASGTNASQLLIDGSVVASSTAASNSISSRPFYIGCLNNNNTAAQFWQGGTKYFFAAQNTGFDYAAALTNLNNLLGALEGDYFSNVVTSQSGGVISNTFTTLVSNHNQPPSIETVTVSGTEEKTQTLTASYTGFTSPGGYSEGTPTYQWYRADNKQSTGSAIVGATSSTYVLAAADVAKYIRVEVTPVQSGGMNTSGTPVTSIYTDQVQDNEFNPLTDINWATAHTPEADDIDNLSGDGWVNRGRLGLNNSVKNGSDAIPTAIADGVDFEASNNEELVLDQPTPQFATPVEIWIRFKKESNNASFSYPLAWTSAQRVEQRAGGAIYLSGGNCSYTAANGTWIVMRFLVSGVSNTSEFNVNNGTELTNIAASTSAFGTSNGRIGANSGGTGNRFDGLISHIFVKSGQLTPTEQSNMWTWFSTYYPWD